MLFRHANIRESDPPPSPRLSRQPYYLPPPGAMVHATEVEQGEDERPSRRRRTRGPEGNEGVLPSQQPMLPSPLPSSQTTRYESGPRQNILPQLPMSNLPAGPTGPGTPNLPPYYHHLQPLGRGYGQNWAPGPLPPGQQHPPRADEGRRQ